MLSSSADIDAELKELKLNSTTCLGLRASRTTFLQVANKLNYLLVDRFTSCTEKQLLKKFLAYHEFTGALPLVIVCYTEYFHAAYKRHTECFSNGS